MFCHFFVWWWFSLSRLSLPVTFNNVASASFSLTLSFSVSWRTLGGPPAALRSTALQGTCPSPTTAPPSVRPILHRTTPRPSSSPAREACSWSVSPLMSSHDKKTQSLDSNMRRLPYFSGDFFLNWPFFISSSRVLQKCWGCRNVSICLSGRPRWCVQTPHTLTPAVAS